MPILRLRPGEPVPILPMVWRWEYGQKPDSWYYPHEREQSVHQRPENQRKRWWACPRSSPPLPPDAWWEPYQPASVCVLWEGTDPHRWERRLARDREKLMEQKDMIEVSRERRPVGLRCDVVAWIETEPVTYGWEAEALVESFGPELDRGRSRESGLSLAGLAAVHGDQHMYFLGTIQADTITGLRDQWRRRAKRWLAGRQQEAIHCGVVYVRLGPAGELRPLEPPAGGALRCPRCLVLLQTETLPAGT